ncbi:MAG: DNA/RNA non-specific endonuclease [Pirellulales bacterium]|nr:DNA/RNA non-specific endonuclease [Pirellulales bacterium]
MNHAERLRRIRAMLGEIAGPDGIESLEAPRSSSMEALGRDDAAERVQETLHKLQISDDLSPEEAYWLEAIVIPDKRPVAFIRDSKFADFQMADWRLLNAAAVRGRLEPLFPSIGRVELPNSPEIPYGGTAFVVGPNLLMTNRHVARLFADGVGARVTYHAGGSAVDFAREDVAPPRPPAPIQVIDVVMIHPYWDMALLKTANLSASAKPLPLSTVGPDAFIDKDVVVVGYPARDYRNDLAVQDQIFESKYGVKRLQPGKARRRTRTRSFGNLVEVLVHDSSTLGGNSGSAIIDVATGTVIGLHFAGEYLKANYAVSTYDLAQDARVVDAGLNFIGSVPPTDTTKQAWAHADGGEGSISPPHGGGGASPPLQSPGFAGDASQAAQFMLPLKITVSFGAPVLQTAADVAMGAGGRTGLAPVADEVFVEKVPLIYPDMDSRTGYQADFLELDDDELIPLPKLTAKGKAIAAKLDDGSHELRYHKFSIVMNKERRLAMFTASNVDWRTERRKINGRKPTRKELNGFTGNEREDWVTDPRIPFDHQLPDRFYTKDRGSFDKGHLVRRDDVAWGDDFQDMQMGNGDTFHTTNCSPQTADFNRPNLNSFNWGALEEMIAKETKSEKACVFAGPVLADGDELFLGQVKSGVEAMIPIPSRYWKIIVANEGGQPAAYGFMLDQDLADVDMGVEFAVPNAWRKLLCPIADIEDALNGWVKLGRFKEWDQFDAE